jgi:hypothetical protein
VGAATYAVDPQIPLMSDRGATAYRRGMIRDAGVAGERVATLIGDGLKVPFNVGRTNAGAESDGATVVAPRPGAPGCRAVDDSAPA